MTLKVGALFAGYSGIELALSSVLDCEPAWFSEFDKAPSKILAHHWPDVPNLGDVTKIRWDEVEPVDVITGGSPCQDLSHAGKRAGMKAGTRSGLWASMCDAIDIIRPRLVVWENVRGAFSAAADSAVEPCPLCVGDGRGVTLRALGRVLGDLSELGYDARWYGLRAADVGAAHPRFRVFVIAAPADAHVSGLGRFGRLEPVRCDADGRGRSDGPGQGGEPKAHGLTLLPTPACNDMGEGKTVEAWDEWTARMKSEHGNGNGHGKSLAIEAQRLLPTPTVNDSGNTGGGPDANLDTREGARANLHNEVMSLLPTPSVADVEGGRKHRSGDRSGELLLNGIAHHQAWGDYAAAIARHEAMIGRPAPAPTEPGPKDNPRLSPRFVEWLMGLPAGHVTDVDISRNDMLKALGNGVVPQQCAAALRAYIQDEMEAAA